MSSGRSPQEGISTRRASRKCLCRGRLLPNSLTTRAGVQVPHRSLQKVSPLSTRQRLRERERRKEGLRRQADMENNLSLTLDALASSGVVISTEQKVGTFARGLGPPPGLPCPGGWPRPPTREAGGIPVTRIQFADFRLPLPPFPLPPPGRLHCVDSIEEG